MFKSFLGQEIQIQVSFYQFYCKYATFLNVILYKLSFTVRKTDGQCEKVEC